MRAAAPIKVTDHALQRYRERIDPLAGDDAVMAVLTGRTVRFAAEFGCRIVRIPRGRIVLEFQLNQVVVITVLGIWDNLPRTLLPAHRGGPMPIAHQLALIKQAGDGK